MPAGVSWPVYLKHLGAAMAAMYAGAQCVHVVYRPLDDLDDMVEEEKARLLKERKRPTDVKEES